MGLFIQVSTPRRVWEVFLSASNKQGEKTPNDAIRIETFPPQHPTSNGYKKACVYQNNWTDPYTYILCAWTDEHGIVKYCGHDSSATSTEGLLSLSSVVSIGVCLGEQLSIAITISAGLGSTRWPSSAAVLPSLYRILQSQLLHVSFQKLSLGQTIYHNQ